MTEEGKALYERVTQNRPKLIKEEGDIYTFECSEKLAKVYFAPIRCKIIQNDIKIYAKPLN